MTATLAKPAAVERGWAQTPPLNNGDRLTRTEFERRYHLHPEIKVAELIEGSVYVASPVHFEQHGKPHWNLVTWTGVYSASTPAVRGADSTTVCFDLENEAQPDIVLYHQSDGIGQVRVSSDDYLEGPPELIVEVAAGTASYDLHQKLRVCQRSGVQEYIVAQAYERRFDWFVLRAGLYEPMQPDERGVLRSEVFPGLWLKPSALWEDNLATMLAVLQEGLASPEHATFVGQVRAE